MVDYDMFNHEYTTFLFNKTLIEEILRRNHKYWGHPHL